MCIYTIFMLLLGSVLKGDHSFKITNRLSLLESQSTFDALYSVTNESGQIRGQMLTSSKSHAQIASGLAGIRDGLSAMGFAPPECFYTDDASQDRTFLEGKRQRPAILHG
jgi:hypothetical protein